MEKPLSFPTIARAVTALKWPANTFLQVKPDQKKGKEIIKQHHRDYKLIYNQQIKNTQKIILKNNQKSKKKTIYAIKYFMCVLFFNPSHSSFRHTRCSIIHQVPLAAQSKGTGKQFVCGYIQNRL